MKTRLIVSGICLPVLFAVIIFLPALVLALLISLVSALAAYELISAAGEKPAMRLILYGMLGGAALPVLAHYFSIDLALRATLVVLMTLVFGEAVFSCGKAEQVSFKLAITVIFAGTVFPYAFSSILCLRLMDNGKYLVFLPFVVAFITDSGAYFTGVFLGKRKVLPDVSPNKTLEGFIGGIVCAVVFTQVYGLIVHLGAKVEVNHVLLLVYGFLGGLVTELGDLAFSLIKREFGIKDYGNLLPGHGGMLDRLDSMVFAAPAVLLLVQAIPAF